MSISAITGIVTFVFAKDYLPKDNIGIIYASYVLVLSCCFILYFVYIHTNKPHRFIEIPHYVHYANHTVRDFLEKEEIKLRKGDLTESDLDENLKTTVISILDQTSACFSIITGKRCSSCIKSLDVQEKILTIGTIYRDSASGISRGKHDSLNRYEINKDTACHSVYQIKDGCLRIFICNNVVQAYKEQRFTTPSFAVFGGPPGLKTNIFRQTTLDKPWPLPFKSCIASPIRYIQQHKPEGLQNDHYNYWGFLCIDSEYRNAFTQHNIDDIAGCFSDILFILFQRTAAMKEIIKNRKKLGNTSPLLENKVNGTLEKLTEVTP